MTTDDILQIIKKLGAIICFSQFGAITYFYQIWSNYIFLSIFIVKLKFSYKIKNIFACECHLISRQNQFFTVFLLFPRGNWRFGNDRIFLNVRDMLERDRKRVTEYFVVERMKENYVIDGKLKSKIAK